MTGHAESVPPVLAIDGPSGTGKGTIAGRVAEQLGWHILDSGALYRAIGFLAVENHIEPNDIRALRVLAESSVVEFSSTPTGVNILVDQRDITEEVRSESGAKNASIYAKIPALREALLKRQRALRAHPGLVADGRDMGTVVFPDAFLKVFLDASASVRAERRHNQLREKGFDVK
ncbi:MAG TPA: (d)CMP kinase, partial [Gammaproteobacteria bacterium]|nr:(d)CMP kinase [Gammaproteobacteria bacterium]